MYKVCVYVWGMCVCVYGMGVGGVGVCGEYTHVEGGMCVVGGMFGLFSIKHRL